MLCRIHILFRIGDSQVVAPLIYLELDASFGRIELEIRNRRINRFTDQAHARPAWPVRPAGGAI